MTALRLIIQNHPSWQQTRPEDQDVPAHQDNLPVESYKIYTILGRRNMQWHTIVPRIENYTDAIDAMDSANRSALFDRLVIAEAQSIAGQPATRWETSCCALPAHLRHWEKPSFESILTKLQRDTAHKTPPGTLLLARPEKQDATLFLVLLVGVGIWSQTWPVLAGVMALCLFEIAYQASWLDKLIPVYAAKRIHTLRLYLYALCAGLIALPLAAAAFLKIPL